MSVIFVGSLFAQFVVGWASDRFGRRLVLGVGLGLLAVVRRGDRASTSLRAHARRRRSSRARLRRVRRSSGNVMSSELAPARRASAVNLVNTFFGVGAVVGPLVVSLLLQRTGASLPALWIGAALLAVSAVVGALALPDRLPAPRTRADGGDRSDAWRCLAARSDADRLRRVPDDLRRQRDGGRRVGGDLSAAVGWHGRGTQRRGDVAVLGRADAGPHRRRRGRHARQRRAPADDGGVDRRAPVRRCCGPVTDRRPPSVTAFAIIGLGYGPIYPTGVAVLTSRFPHAAGTATSRMGILAAIGGALLPWIHGLVLAHRPTRRQRAADARASSIAMIVAWEWTRRLAHRAPGALIATAGARRSRLVQPESSRRCASATHGVRRVGMPACGLIGVGTGARPGLPGPASPASRLLAGLLARLRRADGAARHDVLDGHDPLVVLPPVLEDPDGLRRALAHHRRDARRRPARSVRSARVSTSASPPPGVPAGCRRPSGRLRWAAAWCRRRRADAGRAGPAGRKAGVVVVMPGLRLQLERRQQPEVAVRDRVLVLLAQELLAQQDIDVRRERVGVFPLVQRDGARVLPGPEDQLGFLLALDRLLPDRHRPSSRRRP